MDISMYSFMNRVRESGLARSIPLIEDSAAQLLQAMASCRTVNRVLEIGTAIGYSTLWLASGLGLNLRPGNTPMRTTDFSHKEAQALLESIRGCRMLDPESADDRSLVTMELDPRRIVEAAEILEGCGLGPEVSLIAGDALENLTKLHKPFQLIFLDGGKSENLAYINSIIKQALLDRSGFLLVDNIDLRPERTSQRYNRIRASIDNFLNYIEGSGDWKYLKLPMADGILIAQYIPGQQA